MVSEQHSLRPMQKIVASARSKGGAKSLPKSIELDFGLKGSKNNKSRQVPKGPACCHVSGRRCVPAARQKGSPSAGTGDRAAPERRKQTPSRKPAEAKCLGVSTALGSDHFSALNTWARTAGRGAVGSPVWQAARAFSMHCRQKLWLHGVIT